MRVQIVHRLGDEEKERADDVHETIDQGLHHIAQHVNGLQSAIFSLELTMFICAAGLALMLYGIYRGQGGIQR